MRSGPLDLFSGLLLFICSLFDLHAPVPQTMNCSVRQLSPGTSGQASLCVSSESRTALGLGRFGVDLTHLRPESLFGLLLGNLFPSAQHAHIFLRRESQTDENTLVLQAANVQSWSVCRSSGW